jgi:peptidoglycan hydrolase CwlO-like protein
LNKTINDLTANQQEHEKKFIDISEQLMEKVKQLSKLEQTKDDLLHENEELKAKFRL